MSTEQLPCTDAEIAEVARLRYEASGYGDWSRTDSETRAVWMKAIRERIASGKGAGILTEREAITLMRRASIYSPSAEARAQSIVIEPNAAFREGNRRGRMKGAEEMRDRIYRHLSNDGDLPRDGHTRDEFIELFSIAERS